MHFRNNQFSQTKLPDVSLVFRWRGCVAGPILLEVLLALAVTTPTRSAALPAVPALAELWQGFSIDTWWGLVAPAGTPRDVLDRLNKAFTEALRAPETQTRYAQLMAEPVPTTPEQFGDFMKKELARYEPVVKASGARVD